MIEQKKENGSLFVSMVTMLVVYAWIAFFASLMGIFYPIGIWISWILICGVLFKYQIIAIAKPSRSFILYGLIGFIFTAIIAFYTVPTIFSGRDQGSLAEASMQLAQHHNLISHSAESDAFFALYGRGKALNFPGFYYVPDGGVLTQFPIPYIAFLGGFYGIFGIYGFILANSILLFITIISLTFIARLFMNQRFTLIFLGLLLSSFSLGWFAKFTLSENFANAILWSSVALYLIFKKTHDRKIYIMLFLGLSLLLFTRIEGIWFFGIIFFFILHNHTTRAFIMRDLWWHLIFPLTVLCAIAIIVCIMNYPFIIAMLHALFDATQSSQSIVTSYADKLLYYINIYALYGLIGPFLITAFVCALSIRVKKYRACLFLISITFPLFMYYVSPQITSDHPWMLRRFVFALLPATIFTSVYALSFIHINSASKKIFVYGSITALFLMNIPAFYTFIFYAENDTLQSQTHTLAQNFSDEDLILIDQNATGDGWSMITNPLRTREHKHAAYIFNPHDLAKLDTKKFNRVFLIIPDKNKTLYTDVIGDRIYPTMPYSINTSQLSTTSSKSVPQFFPQKENYTVHGYIYELK